MERPRYWADDKAGISLNATSNSTPDKRNDSQGKGNVERGPAKKEVLLNKSTDSKIMADHKKLSDPKLVNRNPEKLEETPPRSQKSIKEPTLNPGKMKDSLRESKLKEKLPSQQSILNPAPKKLKTLIESDDDKTSNKVLSLSSPIKFPLGGS